MPPQTTNAVLLERLTTLTGKVDDVACALKNHNDREDNFEKSYIAAHADVVNLTKDAHARIDTLKERIRANEEAIKQMQDALHPLIYTNKILTALAVLLGGSIFGLIWAILTHSVQIVVP